MPKSTSTTRKTRRSFEAALPPHPIFEGMQADELERLVSGSLRRKVAANEILMQEQRRPHAVYVLESGSVRLFNLSPDGMEVTLEVLKAPALFGGTECLLGLGYMNSAETLETARVMEVPPELFQEAVGSSHEMCQNVLRDVAGLLCVSSHRQRATAFDPVATRLAHVLLSYADAYGLPVHEGTRIRLPINQNHMASVLGVSRRSVTRALKLWSKDGTVRKQGGYYVIRDEKRLAAIAGDDLLPMVYSSDLPLRAWVPRMVVSSRPSLPRSPGRAPNNRLDRRLAVGEN